VRGGFDIFACFFLCFTVCFMTQKWTVADSERTRHAPANLAEEGIWPNDRDQPSLTYQGPFGPAYVAYFDGFLQTRVWGPAVPEGYLADGPELASDRLAKLARLRSGVQGHIGSQPLHVAFPNYGWFRSQRVLEANLANSVYRLRVCGFPIVRVVLERANGQFVWRYAVRFPGSNRASNDVTPSEVTLALLLWSTPGPLTPHL